MTSNTNTKQYLRGDSNPLITVAAVLFLLGISCFHVLVAQGVEEKKKELEKHTVDLRLRNASVKRILNLEAENKGLTVKMEEEAKEKMNRKVIRLRIQESGLGRVFHVLMMLAQVRGQYEGKNQFSVSAASRYGVAGLWLSGAVRFSRDGIEDSVGGAFEVLRKKQKLNVVDLPLVRAMGYLLETKGGISYVLAPDLAVKEEVLGTKVDLDAEEEKPLADYLENVLSENKLDYVIINKIMVIGTREEIREFTMLPPDQRKKLKKHLERFLFTPDTSRRKQLQKLKIDYGTDLVKTFCETYGSLIEIARDEKEKALVKKYGSAGDLFRDLSSMAYHRPHRLSRKAATALREKIALSGYFKDLIQKLGARRIKKRKSAMERLRVAGHLAEPELKDARDSENAERKKRVRELLEALEK